MKKRLRRWSKDDLDRLHCTKDFITQNLSEELLLRDLAAKTAMNEKKLKEAFFFLYGIRIKQFILQERMKKAHDHIVHTDAPIKGIHHLCGYRDLSSFYRAFTSYYGYTPASLRNLS